jgi:hypothetical protein
VHAKFDFDARAIWATGSAKAGSPSGDLRNSIDGLADKQKFSASSAASPMSSTAICSKVSEPINGQGWRPGRVCSCADPFQQESYGKKSRFDRQFEGAVQG